MSKKWSVYLKLSVKKKREIRRLIEVVRKTFNMPEETNVHVVRP
jgi:hypothetical protein